MVFWTFGTFHVGAVLVSREPSFGVPVMVGATVATAAGPWTAEIALLTDSVGVRPGRVPVATRLAMPTAALTSAQRAGAALCPTAANAVTDEARQRASRS